MSRRDTVTSTLWKRDFTRRGKWAAPSLNENNRTMMTEPPRRGYKVMGQKVPHIIILASIDKARVTLAMNMVCKAVIVIRELNLEIDTVVWLAM